MASAAYLSTIASKDAPVSTLQVVHLKVARHRVGDHSVMRGRVAFTIHCDRVDKLVTLRDETIKHRPQKLLLGIGVTEVKLLGLLSLIGPHIALIKYIQTLRLQLC